MDKEPVLIWLVRIFVWIVLAPTLALFAMFGIWIILEAAMQLVRSLGAM